MRICDNDVYRDATPEEVEAFNNTPAPGNDPPTVEDILNTLFGGDAE